MNRSLKDTLKVTQILAAQALTASTKSDGADASLGESLALALSVGTFAFGGGNTMAVRMEHADVNSDASYAAVVTGDVFGVTVGSNGLVVDLDDTDADAQTYLFHYQGGKKFVRFNLIETGTVNCVFAAHALNGHLEAAPPA